MKQIQASCFKLGTLTIPTKYFLINGAVQTGNYADHTFYAPEKLHRIARTYDFLNRNGKTIRGCDYTLKMATNDFNKFSEEN